MVVECDDTLGRTGQVGDDEPDTREEFAGMPLDLGDRAAFPAPRSSPIAEGGVEPPHMVRRTADRSIEEMGNMRLKYRVRLEADRVLVTLGF